MLGTTDLNNYDDKFDHLFFRKNFLFCIDDVDVSDKSLPLFVKFFTERRTWLSKNAGVVHYPNQVCRQKKRLLNVDKWVVDKNNFLGSISPTLCTKQKSLGR